MRYVRPLHPIRDCGLDEASRMSGVEWPYLRGATRLSSVRLRAQHLSHRTRALLLHRAERCESLMAVAAAEALRRIWWNMWIVDLVNTRICV